MKNVTCLVVSLVAAFAISGMTAGKATPLPAVTGTIASNRLGEEQVEFLRSADRVEAFATLVTPAGKFPLHTTRWDSTTEGLQGKKFTRTLTSLLLNDKTYASAPDFHDASGHSRNFLPMFSLCIRNSVSYMPFIVVDVDPDAQELRVMAPCAKREHHPTELYANYALVAPQLTALLKKAYPASSQVQALKAWPVFVKPIPFGIPQEVRQQIAELHPGMTRAGVLELFGTEGGLSSRFQHTYVWKGPSVGSQLIKVDVEFVPKEVHFQWVNGAAIVIDPGELYRTTSQTEATDDVIVRISPPYLAYSVLD